MSGMVCFDPQQIIARLVAEGVDFVVIGGVAATLQGAELPTLDLDIAYERSRENLERLAASLRSINVRLRGAEDVPLYVDGVLLGNGEIWTFSSPLGDIDCLAHPAGAPAYEQLKARADEAVIGSYTVKVASLDDLIAMKMTTGRAKDVPKLAELLELRRIVQADRLDETGGTPAGEATEDTDAT
jgi:hypothetical protein